MRRSGFQLYRRRLTLFLRDPNGGVLQRIAQPTMRQKKRNGRTA
jgi:hypothetical protein